MPLPQITRALLGALFVLLTIILPGSGCGGGESAGNTASSGTGSGGGPGGSGTAYDATKCAASFPFSWSDCLACCANETAGMSTDDYVAGCIDYERCSTCLGSGACSYCDGKTPEPATCADCKKNASITLDQQKNCSKHPCGYLGDPPSCLNRVQCEYQCTCKRCGGAVCVDLDEGISDGLGNVFHCGSCDTTCTNNIYCIYGQCTCDGIPYCGGG